MDTLSLGKFTYVLRRLHEVSQLLEQEQSAAPGEAAI